MTTALPKQDNFSLDGNKNADNIKNYMLYHEHRIENTQKSHSTVQHIFMQFN